MSPTFSSKARLELASSIQLAERGKRALLSITCCTKRREVGNQATIDDIRRRLFNPGESMAECVIHAGLSSQAGALLTHQIRTPVALYSW